MLQKPTLRRSKVLREMASFKKRHKAHVNFNVENFAMQAEMKKKTISGWSMVKQPGDEEERYSGDERATQSPRGPQWNKLPHTHALTQTLPRLGAWSCICSGLMSHQKAGCDQRPGERENTETHPPEMLILGTLCTRERSGLPAGDMLRERCLAPRLAPRLQPKWKHMGEEAVCSPQPNRHHMQNHPAWHNQEKQSIGGYRRGMSSSASLPTGDEKSFG